MTNLYLDSPMTDYDRSIFICANMEYQSWPSTGGTVCTSQEALQRFFERLQTDKDIVETPPCPQTPTGNRQTRQVERELRMAGFDGDARIFERFHGSKVQLCDLHEHLHNWMPDESFSKNRPFLAVRSGIFARAARILAGKDMEFRRYVGAIRWIESLDLATIDVTELDGVGPLYGAHGDRYFRPMRCGS